MPNNFTWINQELSNELLTKGKLLPIPLTLTYGEFDIRKISQKYLPDYS